MLFFIAWRNLWRNKHRSVLTISALGGGLAMLILYAALLNGMVMQMTEFSTKISSGSIQVHRQSFIDDQDLYATIPWKLIDSLEKEFEHIAITPRLYAAGLASAGETSTGAMLKAVDPQRESKVTTMLSHIREGDASLQAITTNENGFPRYQVVVGAQFAKNLNLKIGDELVIVSQAADGSIGNDLFFVSGILKPIELTFDRTGVLMSIEAFQNLMYLQSGAHELAVSIDSQENILTTKSLLQKKLHSLVEQYPLDIEDDQIVTRTWRELMPAVSDMVEVSKAAIYILGIIMLGLASMGMLNTMMMSIYERKHEFGILLSIGMGRYWLLLMVMLESLFIACVSAIIGAVVGSTGAIYLEKHGIDLSGYMPDGFDYGGIIFEPMWRAHLDTESIYISIFLTLGIALIASLIPSWRIVKLKPVEALH